MTARARLVATDLDGTLLSSNQQLSEVNRASLEGLGARGVVRVVATGRSLYSARKVMDDDWPIDYLVFSSGAGIVDWPAQRLMRSVTIPSAEVARAVTTLAGLNLDFMVHAAIPDNHWFFEWCTGRVNEDFERRRELYSEYILGSARELVGRRAMTQFVVVVPPGQLEAIDQVRDALGQFKVIRTTSPLDGKSMWIEVFPRAVSKARGTAWLRELVAPGAHTIAVGNDYNDIDLLEWANASFVVANAAPELLARHRVVGTNDEGGFAEAVLHWNR